jgi:phage-related protein (TIGR01555 family)
VIYDAHGRPYEAPVKRADGWENFSTGIGTLGDKTTRGRFTTVQRLNDTELTNLFNGSSIAAKVVEKRPTEMFRAGYKLKANDVGEDDAKDLQDYANEELHVDEWFLTAKVFEGLYGGYLLVLGADDGGMPWEPLVEERIKTFAWINGMDRRFAYVNEYYPDDHPKAGQPMTYLTSNAVATPYSGTKLRGGLKQTSASRLRAAGFSTAIIHETRCIRFGGVRTDVLSMQSLAGWGWSLLQRIYDGLRKFEHAFDATSYLLSDASQAVFKRKGLFSAISNGQLDAIRQRLRLLEEWRSVAHAVLLDSEGEEFERAPTSFAGISDLLDKMMLKFAAEADTPVTEIFGRAASGLNAAAGADSETRKWYDKIRGERETQLAPMQRRVYRLIARSQDCPVTLPKGDAASGIKWTIDYGALWEPTDQEQAETDLKVAQRDAIYAGPSGIGAYTAEEIAIERQRLYPSADMESREAAIEGATAFDPYENDEPDEPPPGTVPPGTPAPPGAPPAPVPPPPPAPAGKLPAKKTAKKTPPPTRGA